MPTEFTDYDPTLGNKFVFVTGGVMSGLGKGITAASTGRLLANAGFDVTVGEDRSLPQRRRGNDEPLPTR